jgi:aspartate aminotransferase-like enzyme
MKKKYIVTPGPVDVPPQVLLAMAQPIIHHRSPEYTPIFKEVNEGLQYVFQTQNPVLTFASSGSGAMESAVVNLLSPGDKMLAVVGGKFGERWADIGKAYGLDPIVLEVEWGYSVKAEQVEAALKKNPDVKVVYTTLCESSTGALLDVKAIAEVVKKTNAILVVDAISGLLTTPLKTDEWGIDVVVGGSQKALMTPPGLAFAAVGPRAIALNKESKLPKFYFSWQKALKNLEKDTTPFTPAITTTFGLQAALKMIREEGIENVWKRHDRLASAMRAGVVALGLNIYTKDVGPTLTAICAPEGVDGKAWLKVLRDKFGVTAAGGQGDVTGKIIRIAQMGYASTFDVTTALSAVELSLSDMGYKVNIGAGVKAALEYLNQNK